MIAKTEAFVLKTHDFRETSKIAVFYTKEFGKVKGVMKGIRKDYKKFGSSVDRFSLNDMEFYRHRNSDLHLISLCDLKQYYFPIRKDLKRNIAANYVLELVDVIMPPENPNTNIYALMNNFFKDLQSEADIDRLIHIFQIKTLIFSGFRPHIDDCLKCTKHIDNKAKFSLKTGGLICNTCSRDEHNLLPISKGTISTILYYERHSWDHCLKLGLTSHVKKELKVILNNFLVYHLERKIKTAKYF